MRWSLMLGVCAFAGCASGQLASTPAAGVDLSGHWTLNLADSDDAQRLMQSQIAAATAGVNSGGAGGGRDAEGPGSWSKAGPGSLIVGRIA